MSEFILRIFRNLFAQPQQETLLIPVRVEEKRKLYTRR